MLSILKLFLTSTIAVSATSGIITTFFVVKNLKIGKNYSNIINYVKETSKDVVNQIKNIDDNLKTQISKANKSKYKKKNKIKDKNNSLAYIRNTNNIFKKTINSIYLNKIKRSQLQQELFRLNGILEKI